MNAELMQVLDGLPGKIKDGILTAKEAMLVLRIVGQMIFMIMRICVHA